MKKVLCLVTLLLAGFTLNASATQDEKIDEALRSLARTLWSYSEELQTIQNNLVAIAKTESSESYNQAGLVLDLTEDVEDVETILKYEFFILVTKPFINKDKIKPYCRHIWHTLEYSSMHIKSLQNHLHDIYGLVENKAALHSVDRAKKIIKDSLAENESTMDFLDKAVKSMP